MRILHIDAELVAVDKPAGLLVHPSALDAHEERTAPHVQIRQHFKHIPHPLVGDTTHGKGDHNRAVAKWLGVQRLWLHAVSVEIAGRPAGTGAVRGRVGAASLHAIKVSLPSGHRKSAR